MNKARKLQIVIIGALLVGAAAVAYRYVVESQRQNEAAEIIIQDGIAQFFRNEHELAMQTFGSIPQDSEDWRISYYTGAALIKLKDYEEAVGPLEKALLLNDNEKDIPFALGVVYFKLGNLSLSKGYFHSVLELDPDHAEAKGLMDIMARLERYQTQQPTTEPEQTTAPETPENSGDL